jgi:hypothetical protein
VPRRIQAEPGNVVAVDSAMAGDGEGITTLKRTVTLVWWGPKMPKKEGVDSNDGIGLCCGVTLGVTDALRRVCLDSEPSRESCRLFVGGVVGQRAGL